MKSKGWLSKGSDQIPFSSKNWTLRQKNNSIWKRQARQQVEPATCQSRQDPLMQLCLGITPRGGAGGVLSLFTRWKKPIGFRAAQRLLRRHCCLNQSPCPTLTRIWLCRESYSCAGKGKKGLKTRGRTNPQSPTQRDLVQPAFIHVSMRCKYSCIHCINHKHLVNLLLSIC